MAICCHHVESCIINGLATSDCDHISLHFCRGHRMFARETNRARFTKNPRPFARCLKQTNTGQPCQTQQFILLVQVYIAPLLVRSASNYRVSSSFFLVSGHGSCSGIGEWRSSTCPSLWLAPLWIMVIIASPFAAGELRRGILTNNDRAPPDESSLRQIRDRKCIGDLVKM